MKRYIFKEIEIAKEYRYIFLCGTHYGKKNKSDKRNVLREFLKGESRDYRPIILEDNFIFAKNNSRYLVYDDIHMKDLYQVEMLTNYLSDNNIIIHESISTGAETGLFLSEEKAMKKTCLLVPDEMAVEESKIGQFIRLAFLRESDALNVITFYPRVEKNVISDNVKYWHTYFYGDKIGANLRCNILEFLNQNVFDYKICFTRNKERVAEGLIHYYVNGRRLEITVLPRVLLCCIAATFNINELSALIFNADAKELKEYIDDIKQYLLKLFINSIEEKTGMEIDSCSIIAQMNVNKVYIAEIIGMCLYLFQAADFINIVKDDEYDQNGKVQITRKMVVDSDRTNHFFYEKYKECINCAIETQIV